MPFANGAMSKTLELDLLDDQIDESNTGRDTSAAAENGAHGQEEEGNTITMWQLSFPVTSLAEARELCKNPGALKAEALRRCGGVCESNVMCVFLCNSICCIDWYVCLQVCVTVLLCVSFYVILFVVLIGMCVCRCV